MSESTAMLVAEIAELRQALADGERAGARAAEVRMLAIAHGCTDYGGGYESGPLSAAFQHGIGTVIRALAKGCRHDALDTQTAALERMGRATLAKQETQT